MHQADLLIFQRVNYFGNLLIIKQLSVDMASSGNNLLNMNTEGILYKCFSNSEGSNFNSDGNSISDVCVVEAVDDYSEPDNNINHGNRSKSVKTILCDMLNYVGYRDFFKYLDNKMQPKMPVK